MWRSCGPLDEVSWCGVRAVSWVGGGVRVEFGLGGQVCSDGISLDVSEAAGVVVGVENTTAIVAAFPHVEFALQAKGKSSFDVLHCFFEGDIGRRR